MAGPISIVEGDITRQEVDAIVNAKLDIRNVTIAAAVDDVAPDAIEEDEESKDLGDETSSTDEKMAQAEG